MGTADKKVEDNMAQPLVMWRADTKKWRAIQVECSDGLYLEKDADGVDIYENTHFKTAEEAWESLERESMAWLKGSTKELKRLKSSIEIVKDEIAEAAEKVVLVRERMNK